MVAQLSWMQASYPDDEEEEVARLLLDRGAGCRGCTGQGWSHSSCPILRCPEISTAWRLLGVCWIGKPPLTRSEQCRWNSLTVVWCFFVVPFHQTLYQLTTDKLVLKKDANNSGKSLIWVSAAKGAMEVEQPSYRKLPQATVTKL